MTNLFLVSGGDYLRGFETHEGRLPLQGVLVIEGDEDLEEAKKAVAKARNIDIDEVVVNPLGEPM